MTTELKHTQITIFLEIRVRYGTKQTRGSPMVMTYEG